MIVYSATVEQFINEVKCNQISTTIYNKLREYNVSGGEEREYISWQNSLNFMCNVLDNKIIPSDADVAIEYVIPKTSKRVDFIISGSDEYGKNNVIIIELKQWTKAEKKSDESLHSVVAYTGGGLRTVNHPSYQAYAYSVFIKNASAVVQDENIDIIPCAYLHNYDPKYVDQLKDPIYKIWYDEAPFFIRDQYYDIQRFIYKYIKVKSSDKELLYRIDNGRIRPSKALQDAIVSVLKGNKEFLLLDDQAVAYDICIDTMKDCIKDQKKRTIIIQGGPGTGKSVLAINLLKELTTRDLNTSYVTKNSAPREAYLRLLSKSDLKKEVKIKSLFRSPFGLCRSPINFYDCLIIDEAHRLVRQMYRDFHGENQVKECIQASLLSIFLIDEDQRITTKDIGSIAEIKYWANVLGSEVICCEDTVLKSQFRCNGSDLYIQLINNILQISDYVDIRFDDLKYDFQVFDDPNEMRDKLREINKINNKARMVAGYCYDWNVKYHRGEYDIELENNFKAKWNLEDDKIWAINEKSFEEVGCIHTAQGLEFDYVGVIIGQDLRYDDVNKKLIIDPSKISKDDKSSGIRNASIQEAKKLIKNTYKTLLTRGQKGCFIYCEDKALSNYIKQWLRKLN